jgi:hypothetical protein
MKKTPEDDVIALAANIQQLQAQLAKLLAADFVSTKKAAHYLGGISVQAVQDRIKRGTLRAVNVDGRWRIHLSRLPL